MRDQYDLAALDLLENDLREAVRAGYMYAPITEYTPPVASGMLLWSAIHHEVRERLVPEGWDMQHDLNYATTVHPQGHMAISVEAGNHFTGQADLPANTQAAKGPATLKIVNCNQLGFRDIDVAAWDPGLEEDSHDQSCLTWLLLHYHDPFSNVIKLELSLPMVMRQGRVTEWQQRIMIRPVNLSDSTSWNSPTEIDLSDLVVRKEDLQDDDREIQSSQA